MFVLFFECILFGVGKKIIWGSTNEFIWGTIQIIWGTKNPLYRETSNLFGVRKNVFPFSFISFRFYMRIRFVHCEIIGVRRRRSVIGGGYSVIVVIDCVHEARRIRC